MIPHLVVDATVAVKWFLPDGEDAVDEAIELLHAHGRGDIVIAAPEHGQLELLSALRSRGFAADALPMVADRLLLAEIEWAPLGPLLAETVRLSSAHRLTMYDAAYAALALRLDAELVTGDLRLAGCGVSRCRLLGRGGSGQKEGR
jgi:predicted nucleic acid-binding protein